MAVDLPKVVRLARLSVALTHPDAVAIGDTLRAVQPGLVVDDVQTFESAQSNYGLGHVADDWYLAIEGAKSQREVLDSILSATNIEDLGHNIRVNPLLWAYAGSARLAFARMMAANPRSITISGHSGGGANSLVLAAMLSQQNYGGDVNIVTFGSPKPMTEGGVALANVYAQQNYRLRDDPITECPPSTSFAEGLLTVAAFSLVATPVAGIAVGALQGIWNQYAQVARIQLGERSFFETNLHTFDDHRMVNYYGYLEGELPRRQAPVFERVVAMVTLSAADIARIAAYVPIADSGGRYGGASPARVTDVITIINDPVARDADTMVRFLRAYRDSVVNSPESFRTGEIAAAVMIQTMIDLVQNGYIVPANNAAADAAAAARIAAAAGLRAAPPSPTPLATVPLNEAGFQAERARLQDEIARLQAKLDALRSQMMLAQPTVPGFAPAVPSANGNAVPAPSNAAPGFPPATPSYAPIDPRNPYRRY